MIMLLEIEIIDSASKSAYSIDQVHRKCETRCTLL